MSDAVVRPQLSPYQVTLEKGKSYRFCVCGRSKSQPFCDDAHEGTGHAPLEFVAQATETVNICGCKESTDPPYCDGAHLLL